MEKSQAMFQSNPMMAQSLMAQQYMMANPDRAKSMEMLKDDPEFAEMFAEIKEKGPEALSKYWDDVEMMSKISKKMEALQMQQQEGEEGGQAGSQTKQPHKQTKAVT
eukprot:scaffold676992_cov33-Prasinocladus_malaysianus.AAC.1